MKLSILSGCLIAITILAVAGCEKKTDDYKSDALEEYFNLEVGKYVIYQLDSTLFIEFGQKDTVVYHHAKEVVEAQITDNLGRPGWRITRYLRDTSSTSEDDWKAAGTYTIIPTRETVEVIEDNFRQVKLKLPVKEGYNWLGNSYLPFDPYIDHYVFSNDEDIQYWNYTYQDVGASQSILNKLYDSTLTVWQVADSVNVPITFPDGIAYKNYWVEKYAKGIGLIYKEVLMWEYQPPNGGNPGYRHGFGIRLQVLDHN